MIKKVLTVCYKLGNYKMGYEEEFLYPKEIRPTKVTNIGTAIATARNTLAIGHRRRNSRVGEVM